MKSFLLLVATCSFIITSFVTPPLDTSLFPGSPLTFEVQKYSWMGLHEDEDTRLYVEKKKGFIDVPSGLGLFLVKIDFIHPEKNVVPKTGKKMETVVGVFVADFKKKEYTFVLIQVIYTDKTIEDFPLPKELKYEKITDAQIKDPKNNMEGLYSFVNIMYQAAQGKNENRDPHRPRHLDKEGKMII